MSTACGGREQGFSVITPAEKGIAAEACRTPYAARWEYGRIPLFLSPPPVKRFFGTTAKAREERLLLSVFL